MDIQAIEDQEFGPLTWNAELLEWQGESQMSDSTPFHLSISTPASLHYPHIDKTKPDSTVTREARLALRSIRRGDAHIRAKVGDKYVGLYADDGDSILPKIFRVGCCWTPYECLRLARQRFTTRMMTCSTVTH